MAKPKIHWSTLQLLFHFQKDIYYEIVFQHADCLTKKVMLNMGYKLLLPFMI